MNRQAVIETWPSEALLFVPDLPGFQVNASTPEQAISDATDRLDQYVEWLRDGELAEGLTTGGGITVVEQISAIGTAGPIFAQDSEPPTAELCEFALATGRAALSDLLFVYDDVKSDHQSAAKRILRHVAELDRWYATRLAPANGSPFAALEDELVQSASLFEETIDAVTTAVREPVWTIDGESWSVRKALRRRTGHLREHLADLLSLSQ